MKKLLILSIGLLLTACGVAAKSTLSRDESRAEEEGVHISGRRLLIKGMPYVMKSVAWSPVRKGQGFPEGLLFVNPGPDDLNAIEKDLEMMQAMGANTLRTYQPILDSEVLALIERYGFKLIVPVLHSYQTPESRVRDIVEMLRNHPVTLLWEVGNEWNYNLLYSEHRSPEPLTLDSSRELIASTAQLIRSLDDRHPISSVYGEMPDPETIQKLPEIDIWAANIYSGLSFGSRFQDWLNRSPKPFYIGEYGADAVNRDRPDPSAQALAVERLSQEILSHLSAVDPAKALIGGTVFEWSDEWWKDHNGSSSEHDIGGSAPGGGPYPDFIFNEEWWGLVDIDRQPRPAYERLMKIWN